MSGHSDIYLISIRLGHLSRETLGLLVPIGNAQVTEHHSSTTNCCLATKVCQVQDPG